MSDSELLSFPCTVPIKVFGHNDATFRTTALAIVRTHFAAVDDTDVTEIRSNGDRFVSLTVPVQAENRDQLDQLFRELSASEDVLMVL